VLSGKLDEPVGYASRTLLRGAGAGRYAMRTLRLSSKIDEKGYENAGLADWINRAMA